MVREAKDFIKAQIKKGALTHEEFSNSHSVFNRLKELLRNNVGYVGFFTRAHYKDPKNVTFERLENLFYKLNIGEVEFVAKFEEDQVDAVSLHQTRKVLIKASDGEVLGVLGEITKSAHKYFGLKKVRACVFELKMEVLERKARVEKIFDQLSKFPEVNRDLSMTVDGKILAKAVKNRIREIGGEMLKKVELFDNFVNPEDQIRSMAFHLTFADRERTLTAPEVDERVSLIIEGLEKDSKVKIKKV